VTLTTEAPALTGISPERSARAGAWVLLIPACAALLVRLFTGPHAIDDAYITFRYARNFAEGLGLVYNPGEWVLGTTAPLWAVLLAVGYRLGLTDLPWLATLLSALCDAASAALIAHLCTKMGWKPLGATLVGLAWALNPMSVAFATGGMETSLFVLIALVCLALLSSGRRVLVAALLAGIATLVRPEGAFLAVTIVGWTWLARKRLAVNAALIAATPMAISGVTLFMLYGSSLPHSIAAKQVAYLPVEPLENLLVLLVHAGLPGWSTYLLAALPQPFGLLLALFGLVALVGLVVAALPWLKVRRVVWQPFAVFALLYFSFYALVGLRGVRIFNWYLLPIEPLYLLFAAAGLARFGGLRRPALAAILLAWQLLAIDWHQPFLPSGETLLREQLFAEVGQGLRQSLPSTAVIAAPEIGALGYTSNLRVLDTVGLVSPAALPYYPLPPEQLVTDNAIPARLIEDLRPDVVVTLDAYALRTLLTDPTFQRDYHLEASYPAVIWQSTELLVYRRSDVPTKP
jgi:arabinofuranosyltransferase